MKAIHLFMRASILDRHAFLIGALALALMGCGLYLRFLTNPLVFDDKVFFLGRGFAYYATHPFGLNLRLPPLFSIAYTYVISGRIEAHRIVSLVLHIATALALYKLIFELLQSRLSPVDRASATHAGADSMWAFTGAAAFAIHPVAVYGAAYLIERTIVIATLFSLLSMVLFVRGLRSGRYAEAISAALMYSLAVLSKEHSILVPAVAVLALPLVNSNRRFALRYSAMYWVACAPAAVFVLALSRGLIGQAYEPDFSMIADQIEDASGHDITGSPWWVSAVSQAGLFFRYLFLWLWPNTGAMAIDLRFDFQENWSLPWIVLKISAFVAFGAAGCLLLARGGHRGRLAAFGMLYLWILFLVEFSTVRIQEPFVLYRSYLWGPGIVIAAIGFLSCFPIRRVLPAFAVVGAILFFQANDRLVTFSNPLLLWQDAVAKLPDRAIPWGSRPLYNLGREYLYGGQPEKAIEVAERCMALYPKTFFCPFARGAIHLGLEQFDLAIPYLRRALELRPRSGAAHYSLGLALEHLGKLQEAKSEYRRASELGYSAGDYQLRRLKEGRPLESGRGAQRSDGIRKSATGR